MDTPSSDSKVAELRINNGGPITIDDERVIPIDGVGTLFLNRKDEDDDRVRVRALEFEGSGLFDNINVVLAESIAGGKDCPDDDDGGGGGRGGRGGGGDDGDDDGRLQCSDGVDNDGDGLVDFPLDLGCDSAADDDEANGPAGPGTARLDVPGRAGRAIASGRCIGRSFAAFVRGSNISRVTFYVDGRRVSADSDAPFSVRVMNSRRGDHTLSARVTFSPLSRTPARTLRVSYNRCTAKSRFTG